MVNVGVPLWPQRGGRTAWPRSHDEQNADTHQPALERGELPT